MSYQAVSRQIDRKRVIDRSSSVFFPTRYPPIVHRNSMSRSLSSLSPLFWWPSIGEQRDDDRDEHRMIAATQLTTASLNSTNHTTTTGQRCDSIDSCDDRADDYRGLQSRTWQTSHVASREALREQRAARTRARACARATNDNEQSPRFDSTRRQLVTTGRRVN